jgi:endonuclease III-like uncharacterized protein
LSAGRSGAQLRVYQLVTQATNCHAVLRATQNVKTKPMALTLEFASNNKAANLGSPFGFYKVGSFTLF